MNITAPIQILIGSEIEVFHRIAAFLGSDIPHPESAVNQKILADRATATNYHFHTAMREALGDPDADLIAYNGRTGECYAAWTPACESGDGLAHVAILPRKKNDKLQTLPDVVQIA